MTVAATPHARQARNNTHAASAPRIAVASAAACAGDPGSQLVARNQSKYSG